MSYDPQQYDPDLHRQRLQRPPQLESPYPPYGQQQYPPPGYGQQPGPQRPAPPQPSRRRRSWPRRHPFLSFLIAFVTVVVIGVATSAGNGGGTTPPAASGNPAAAAKTVKPHTVATFTGSGENNTSRFTVTSTWKLDYSFNCSSFGGSGNFAVDEDGGSDINGVSVNDLADSKTATSWAYNNAGTHYLAIDSECDWTVTVIDEG